MALTRTVANGCGRLRTVADGWAPSSEHTLNSQTPRVKREPLLYAFGIREKSQHSFNTESHIVTISPFIQFCFLELL